MLQIVSTAGHLSTRIKHDYICSLSVLGFFGQHAATSLRWGQLQSAIIAPIFAAPMSACLNC